MIPDKRGAQRKFGLWHPSGCSGQDAAPSDPPPWGGWQGSGGSPDGRRTCIAPPTSLWSTAHDGPVADVVSARTGPKWTTALDLMPSDTDRRIGSGPAPRQLRSCGARRQQVYRSLPDHRTYATLWIAWPRTVPTIANLQGISAIHSGCIQRLSDEPWLCLSGTKAVEARCPKRYTVAP